MTRPDRSRPPRPLRGGLQVCGTGSDVGKSAVVAGLCRLLARRGVRVAPFKAQNMALNSWVTDEGTEIGHAQGIQARAAGVPAETAMNPILLKPTGERTSQVVVMGRPWAVLDAAAYHAAKPQLWPVVLRALADLRARFDVVVCEGAGSPAEVNLLDHDLVNLAVAAAAGLPAIVVGDIERGGVFASLVGTVALLPERLRRTVRGFVINKFRGDPALLGPGIDELARRTGVPVLGILPYVAGLGFDVEDSLGLEVGALGAPGADLPCARGGYADDDRDRPHGRPSVLEVAVVRFPHISNFTDVDALRLEPQVSLRFVDDPRALGDPDLVVLPGTKTTVADLAWLRASGLAEALASRVRRPEGPVVLGICGGYQMLGCSIRDGIESPVPEAKGLGWLPITTVFAPDKLTRRRTGVAGGPGAGELAGVPVAGYEIRHGRPAPSGVRAGVGPWLVLEPGEAEGMADPSAGVLGTSLHGLLENDELRQRLLAFAARRRGVPWVNRPEVRFDAAREARLDRLADLVASHLDVEAVLALVASAEPVTVEAGPT